MATKFKKGEKFTERYLVESATIYKSTAETAAVRIPGSDHFLFDPSAPTAFDPIRVEAIDRDGKMTDPIEVWSDPDEGILWILDGRGRWLDVAEVNRRRTKDGRELVKPYLVPFNGDEKDALLRLREKNYHRRLPKPSAMATDIRILRNAGFPWEKIAAALHVETDNAEKWGKKLLPIAFCVPEVQAAIDAGEVPRASAARFGGYALDGATKLGKKEQLALLDEMRADKVSSPSKDRAMAPAARRRVREAFNQESMHSLSSIDLQVAKAVKATLARVEGDAKALSAWPAVAALVDDALKPKPKAEKKAKTGKKLALAAVG